jgi:magnesium transporter
MMGAFAAEDAMADQAKDPRAAVAAEPVGPHLLGAIVEALEAGQAAEVARLIDPLHPVDAARLIGALRPADRRALLDLWSAEIDGDILSELDDAIRQEVVGALAPEVLLEAVRDLDSDDVVELVEDLDATGRARVLGALGDADRAAVEQSLGYPEFSAGRLMQREVVTVAEHATVGATIDMLRASDDLPDRFYHVILVDPRMRPIGQASLGRILSSRREVRLADILEPGFRTISATEAGADVAHLFNRYHLISAPVVDAAGRLAGVITIDDAMAVLDEEHAEDVLRLAGVEGEGGADEGVLATVARRLPWLVANLGTASISALVIGQFEATIAGLVLLAALMPIVASTGGIAGTQALAVAVRGLATRSLTRANARRAILRELGAGALNGLALAAVLGLGAWAIVGDAALGVVLGSAMICNQVVASLGGVLVPLGLHRLGLDPALASGTFVTTLTDVMGFLAFLGLASMVLIG